MAIAVKICGLKTPEDAVAAMEADADLVGCVFFPPSPRHVTPQEAAEVFDMLGDCDITRVGLFVDPTDDQLAQTMAHVRLDLVQLHGHETPQRVEEIRENFAVEVMKALPIETHDDVIAAQAYDGVADKLLFDAKPPKDAILPGGNALSFDWTILRDSRWRVPWMLAGGLTYENVQEALKESGAQAVDVSSGVERERGVKDAQLMKQFVQRAKS